MALDLAAQFGTLPNMDKRAEEIRRLSRKGPIDLEGGAYDGSLPRVEVAGKSAGEVTVRDDGRMNCPVCDEDISARAKKCRHCGEMLDPQLREEARRMAGVRPYTRNKSKVAAGILAILLGWCGIHKYYLGRIGQGILYTLFFWTGIPTILGIIEGIIYLTMDDERFWEKYG